MLSAGTEPHSREMSLSPTLCLHNMLPSLMHTTHMQVSVAGLELSSTSSTDCPHAAECAADLPLRWARHQRQYSHGDHPLPETVPRGTGQAAGRAGQGQAGCSCGGLRVYAGGSICFGVAKQHCEQGSHSICRAVPTGGNEAAGRAGQGQACSQHISCAHIRAGAGEKKCSGLVRCTLPVEEFNFSCADMWGLLQPSRYKCYVSCPAPRQKAK